MTLTTARRFQPGDRVQVGNGAAVWTVVADDTDPVHDPEPAYRLINTNTRTDHERRYAYESTLRLKKPEAA